MLAEGKQEMGFFERTVFDLRAWYEKESKRSVFRQVHLWSVAGVLGAELALWVQGFPGAGVLTGLPVIVGTSEVYSAEAIAILGVSCFLFLVVYGLILGLPAWVWWKVGANPVTKWLFDTDKLQRFGWPYRMHMWALLIAWLAFSPAVLWWGYGPTLAANLAEVWGDIVWFFTGYDESRIWGYIRGFR